MTIMKILRPIQRGFLNGNKCKTFTINEEFTKKNTLKQGIRDAAIVSGKEQST